MVTVAALALVPRTPVSDIRRTVATLVPVPLSEVTSNGSPRQTLLGVAGLVMLQTFARPSGPLVLVTMSGWAATITSKPRITLPLLLMTIGKLVPAALVAKPIGITKLI